MNQQQFALKMKEPSFKLDVLQITVKRFYTDVLGTIVDKSTVPAALQVNLPFYVFGEYDRLGGYQLGLKNTPPPNTVKFLQSFTYGIGNPFFYGFTGLSDIQGQLSIGDLVQVYTDDLNAPNYFIYIVQSSPGNRSLVSILANLTALPYDPDYGYIRVKGVDYYTENEEQWKENLKFLKYDMLGLVSSDGVSPYVWKNSKTINDQFIAVRAKFRLDQYIAINSYMLYDTDAITLTFFLEHRTSNLSKNEIQILKP